MGMLDSVGALHCVRLTYGELWALRAYEKMRGPAGEPRAKDVDDLVSMVAMFDRAQLDAFVAEASTVAERVGAAPGGALTEAAMKKAAINSVYGVAAAKTVHPDEDCVLPGEERYGGNDTYLHIRRVLGHKGAFDFCMGNVVKLADRWDKKGDPVENLKKLRDYAGQALVEWRLFCEKKV